MNLASHLQPLSVQRAPREANGTREEDDEGAGTTSLCFWTSPNVLLQLLLTQDNQEGRLSTVACEFRDFRKEKGERCP